MAKKRKLSLKRIVGILLAILVCYLVVGHLGLFLQEKPRELNSYRMDATFAYRGSAENLPIENVALSFSCPRVENRIDFQVLGMWALYWQDENGALYLQTSSTGDYELHPPRTYPLRIIHHGVDPSTTLGPLICYDLDRLYPGEVFWLTAWMENVDTELTLCQYGDNEGRSVAGFWKFSPEGPLDFPIDVSFWAQLSKRVDNRYEPIETFSRFADNRTEAALWLYPS